MPIKIVDNGKANEVSIPQRVMEQQSGTIHFRGNGNKIVLGEDTVLLGAGLTFGHECSFVSGPGVRLARMEFNARRAGHLTIGARTHFTWITKFFFHEPGRIEIGAGGLIASDTLLTVSDMHSVIEVETGKRINPAQDITLHERVWLAAGVSIMKGSVIGAGSIIGLGAVVAGHIPENSMAAGVPAKVIRSGVSWRPDLI